MNICGYYPESINEGEGMRAVLFSAAAAIVARDVLIPRHGTLNMEKSSP